jgi:hypothetical protein
MGAIVSDISLSTSPRVDWRSGLWAAPESGRATAEHAADDTTGAPTIELRSGFFRTDRFVYGEHEPQKVFTTLGLRPQFEQVIGQHPGALREAQKAGTYKALALAGSAATLLGSVLYLSNTLSDANEVGEGNLSAADDGGGNGGLGLMLGGAVVSIVGTTLARSRVREGVRLFNERQAEGEHPAPNAVSVGDVEPGRLSAAVDEAAGPQGAPSDRRRVGLESWYTYWGLGWANPGYSGEVDQTLDVLRDVEGVSSITLDLDLLGFYVPLGGDKTIVGGIINAAAERFEVESESFQINQYLYAASVMHFVDQYVGRGFFVRGDVGLARVVVDSSFGIEATSESGFGFLLGGGYGFAVTPGTRMLLNANYARRSVEGESYSAFSLTLGGLF